MKQPLCTLLVLAGSVGVYGQLSNSAYRVLGQPDLRSNALNQLQGSELRNPVGLALQDSGGQTRLFVADTINNRILIWGRAADGQAGMTADFVLGQSSLSKAVPLATAKGLFNPTSVAIDPLTGNVYVCDFGDNRILRYRNPLDTGTSADPDIVFGQPNFTARTANNGGVTSNSLSGPRSIAFDSSGNLWVSDTVNNRVLRYPAAMLSPSVANPAADLVLGQKDFVTASVNAGAAVSASGFDKPWGLAFDSQGSLYVADFNNARALIFTPPFNTNQAASAVIGQANFTTRTVPQKQTATSLAGPTGISASPAGDQIYIAAPQDNRVLVFKRSSLQSTTAVFGQSGFTAGIANSGVSPRSNGSTLYGPSDVKVDPANGEVYIADSTNNRVLSYAAGQTNAASVWGQANFGFNSANQVKAQSISAAYKMVVDYSRQPFVLYVSDVLNNRVMGWADASHFQNGAPADLILGQPDPYTSSPNFSGAGVSQSASKTNLSAPRGLAVDSSGNLYVADSGNHRVLRFPRPIDQGNGAQPDLVIGQPDYVTSTTSSPTATSLNSPSGLAVAPDNSLFVADSGNNRVLQFPFSTVAATTVFGQSDLFSNASPATSAATLLSPQGIAVDAGFNLYVADTGANRVVIYTGIQGQSDSFSATAVLGQSSFSTNGAAVDSASLRTPVDVAIDPDTNIYVSDNGNNRVLAFSPLFFLSSTGNVATAVFGQPNFSSTAADYNSTDGQATAQSLYSPLGIFADQQGTLYIGDTGNNRIVHVLRQLSILNTANPQSGVPIAKGSLVTLTGTELSTDSQQVSAPLATNAANRTVLIDDSTATLLSQVTPTEVDLQIPSSIDPGSHLLAIRTADTGELIAGGAVTITSSAPSFFTIGGTGKGQAVALNADGSQNSAANPAARGTVVTFTGTGVGSSNPPVDDGQSAPSDPPATIGQPSTDGAACLKNSSLVCMAVGAAFGQIQYSGLQPGMVGVWQVKVTVPATTVPGPTVGVRGIVNAVISTNTPTIAVK